MVRTGLDNLFFDKKLLKPLMGKRIGLIVNPSSVDSSLRRTIDLFIAWGGAKIDVIFGLEHGISGAIPYFEDIGDGIEPVTGILVKSLYGKTKKSLHPPEDLLSSLDTVVFDIQDVGSRYYTYINSFTYFFEPCMKLGVELYVLDRPNPTSCDKIEGNFVREPFFSFVGQYPVPNRHGLTTGELLSYIAANFFKETRINIIPCVNYNRSLYFEDTGLPWVSPSPNMPTPETAHIYTGICLLEGTNISEGRGTAKPFKIFGAPYIKDSFKLAEALNGENLPGVKFHPVSFVPFADKHKGELCNGCEIFITDRDEFNSLLAGIAVVRNVFMLHRDDFRWRSEVYEFVADRLTIDLLLGDDNIRYAIEAGVSIRDIESCFYLKQQEEFRERRKSILLYR